MIFWKCRFALLVLASCLFSMPAWAHDKDVERTLFVQLDDQGLVALWAARGTGQRVELQGKMVDVDRNGKLSDGEKKLLAANTGLANANKAVAQKNGEISKLNQDMNNLLDELDDLDKNLIFQEDTSKNYKKLINCYKTALFTWHGMNSKKGLTKHDHLVINVELRDSLFKCPPM